MTSEAKNLEAITRAINTHNATCPFPAVAVRMSPFELERLGWDTIKGLPLEADPDLGTGEFVVVCDGESYELHAERRGEVPAPRERVPA